MPNMHCPQKPLRLDMGGTAHLIGAGGPRHRPTSFPLSKMIRRDLNDLAEKYENVSGFRKEIDHVIERVRAIEKHLGINTKVAA